MVRGSGHDPVTSESKSTKVLYDGTIERWDAFKMHIRSSLHQKGLWLVVKEGPQQVQVPPAYEGPNTQPPDAGDYYYTLQDMVTQGPVDFRRMLHIINCFKDIGNLNPDTILIHHKSVTNNQWEKWSEELTNKIAVQGALVEEIQSVRLSTSTSQSTVRLAGSGGLPTATPVSGGAPSSIARSLDFGSPSGGPTITSARDREIGQQREPTVDADNAAFHVIVQYINAECSTGMMLLLDIETRFDEDESGHRLYKFLSERASCGLSADGLISADEQRNKIRDWQFCPNETITIEALVMGSTHFKRMWTRQPKARQGMGGDMFDAWAAKLPASPFHSKFIPALDAYNAMEDGSVHGDYDAINLRILAGARQVYPLAQHDRHGVLLAQRAHLGTLQRPALPGHQLHRRRVPWARIRHVRGRGSSSVATPSGPGCRSPSLRASRMTTPGLCSSRATPRRCTTRAPPPCARSSARSAWRKGCSTPCTSPPIR